MANKSKQARAKPGMARAGQVRIIAGKWRGRKLGVADAEGLRPSGDRVRETLFNWLQMQVPGRHCLDLYAGSGALGLEAASRDAASVTLVEKAATVVTALRDNLTLLGAGNNVSVVHTNAESFLASNTRKFDVVFIDPPFADSLHEAILHQLINGHLAVDAQVYVEAPASFDLASVVPPALELHREKHFGDVAAHLYCYG